MTAIILK